MIHLRWRPDEVASLVVDGPSADELAPLVRICVATAEDIAARVTEGLSHL
jgi:hypothetical protein